MTSARLWRPLPWIAKFPPGPYSQTKAASLPEYHPERTFTGNLGEFVRTMPPYSHRFSWRYLLLALVGVVVSSGQVSAQELSPTANLVCLQQPLFGRVLFPAVWKEEPAPLPPGRSVRFAMFGMVPGFLNQPLGLDEDTESNDETGASLPGSATATNTGGLQLLMGNDNPYFDPRLPGDPGGIGYFRVYSQMQLVETGKTSVCLNFQAITPTGQQYGGLNNGPTVLCPAMSLFQELGLGTALQGFVGQNVRAPMHGNEPFSQNLKYGMGVQCPLMEFGGPDRGLYVFMQALGRYYYDGDHPNGRLGNWNFLPGVHLHVNDKCWFSLSASKYRLFTCSWQF